MSLPVQDPQSVAADPAISAFVTANAGSGKTKTLIDRVARLLLNRTRPAAILCVTYTKAAAAEMQRRLFARLGHWAVLEDGKLRAELAALQGGMADDFDAEQLSNARALFASALETPGGLKIQTIHAFCEALLRRFPMEAGISPGFSVMDDVQSAAIAQAARQAVALHAANDGPVGLAYARMSVALDFQSFQSMFAAFEARRGALAVYFDRCGGPAGVAADVWERCDFDAVSSVEAETAQIMGRIDRALWRQAADVLDGGTATDAKWAAHLRAVATDPHATFEAALVPFFTAGGDGTPATWPAKTSGLKSREDLRQGLLAAQADLEIARERARAARVAEETVLALTLAAAYVVAYQTEKAQRSALDFADLIDKVAQLLTQRADAAWVLYKLDGGIDHLLLDEAQDTAPEQWDIIRALTDEFFAGAGTRLDPAPRTLFVVGDEKQSIYSFQGADPARFLAETRDYESRILEAGALAKTVPLITSYRSTPQVLAYVDAVFAGEDTRGAVPPPAGQETVLHAAHRTDGPGCVDLWPLEREVKGEDRGAWDAPLDDSPLSANHRLADRIAAEVVALVARGDAVFEGKAKRPAGFGDVLVLVRRRGALFEEILRALKRRGAPVAGADRLRLSEHIVFDDMMALARVCLYPDDDLTLAALLKSPFIGLDDDSLYALAHGRRTSLWAVLAARAGEQPLWAQGLAFLTWARDQAGRAPPFELFSKALDRTGDDGRSMRMRFLTRLGAEAQDALAEFLSQTAAAEQRGVRDLESLAAAFSTLEMVVKREMDGARGEVRVMTAHGSKGLEAPIVILPEIAFPGGGRGSPLLVTQDGDFPGFLWCSSKTGDCAASSVARTAREQRDAAEALRLLYVALTRARDRLILCGRVAADAKEENVKGWYRAIRSGLLHEAIAPTVRTTAMGDVQFERFGADPVALGAQAIAPAIVVTLPDWTQRAPPPEPAATRYASPSTAWEDGAAVAPSPLAGASGLGRYRRGEIIHRLLQILPDVAPDARRAAATRLLAAQSELDDAQRAEMAAAAFGVLDDPVFADVFAPGSRPEVAIAGSSARLPPDLRVSGRVDRLFVGPDRILVADFKTNRPAPRRIEDADPAYVLQMALYWAVLKALFPDREVEAALVWTDGPKLMIIPEELLAAALVRLAQPVDR